MEDFQDESQAHNATQKACVDVEKCVICASP